MVKVKNSKLLGINKLAIDLNNSYSGIILGIITLAVASILVYNFLHATKTSKTEPVNIELQKSEVQETLPTNYEVLKGDTLVKIAQKFYNDPNKWTLIAKENKLANPSVIHPGNIFVIPQVENVLAQSIITNHNNLTQKEYIVKRGDTLWKIAENIYGDGKEWQRIFDANNLGKLPNGNPLIHAGNVLLIP